MNAESLKNRQNFIEIKEMTFSETWFNSSVTNASVELEGYKLYRLDRLGKIGADVCAHIKITLKAELLIDWKIIFWPTPALASSPNKQTNFIHSCTYVYI